MLGNLLVSLLFLILSGAAGITITWVLVTNDFFMPQLLGFLKSERFKRIFSVKTMVAAFLVCLVIALAIMILPRFNVTPRVTPQPGSGEQSTFTITEMVKNMGGVAIAVVIVLLIMAVYSITIMIERYLTYSAAMKQSREFAPRVAQALENDRIDEAINISEKHRKSHLAMVVSSGLQEFRAHEQSSDTSGEIEASKRALQHAIAMKTAEFRRGLSGLATIGSTAPFIGLFGTVFGIINAFRGMKNAESGIEAVAGGISEALFTTALGLLVAVPAVWLFNYFTGKVDGFIVEMDRSASRLIDYFLKKHAQPDQKADA